MGEFKRGEHANWDPDQKIQICKSREAMLAKVDKESEEEKDESTPMVESSRHVEPELMTVEKSMAKRKSRKLGPKSLLNHWRVRKI